MIDAQQTVCIKIHHLVNWTYVCTDETITAMKIMNILIMPEGFLLHLVIHPASLSVGNQSYAFCYYQLICLF